MTGSDPKTDLHRYLQDAREALLWKLDGLSEYNIRRPMVPTGTNLLLSAAFEKSGEDPPSVAVGTLPVGATRSGPTAKAPKKS